MPLQKFLCALLACILTLHPVLAAASEYRIPLRYLRVAPPVPPDDGAGDGDVDPGANPSAAVLQLLPSDLNFNVELGAPQTRSSLLVNRGRGAAAVSGLDSSNDFSVRHACPPVLAAGASCVVSVTPAEDIKAGTLYNMVVDAPTAKSPAVLKVTAFAPGEAEPAPLLYPEDDLVYLGRLAPGESASASTTLTNVGDADAVLGGISSKDAFSVSSDCPSVLTAGASCTITVTFSSYEQRQHVAALSLTDGTARRPTSLSLIADIIKDEALKPFLAFEPSSVPFGPVDQGTATSQAVVLTNAGTATAVLAPFESTPNFSVSSDCQPELEVGSACTLNITFNALQARTTPRYFLLAKAQAGVTATLPLQGIVNAGPEDEASSVQLSPKILDFSAPVGQDFVKPLTVSNVGLSTVSLKDVEIDFGQDVFSQTNDCGVSLSPGATCTLSVKYHTNAATVAAGGVTVTLGDGSKAMALLTGRGEAAALTVGATSLNVGALVLPSVGYSRSVSVANSGNIPLTGLAVSSEDPRMRIGYGDCTSSLAAHKGCGLLIGYATTEDGPIDSSFTVVSDNGGRQTVAVTGSAVRVSVSPTDLEFPRTPIRTSAQDQYVTLHNEGVASLRLDGIDVVSGRANFGQSNNCGTELSPGGSCVVSVRYTPGTDKPHVGAIGIISQGTLIAQAGLRGTGIRYQLTSSSNAVEFQDVYLQQPSEVRSVVISNPAPMTASITGLSVSTGVTNFAQTNDCGQELAAGAICTINVQMTPGKIGALYGTISIVSSLGTATIALSGNGVADPLTLSRSALEFIPTYIGQRSAVQAVTLLNETPAHIAISGLSVTTGADSFAQTNDCGRELATSAACTINIQMTPGKIGALSGTISIVSSLGRSTISLSGSGIADPLSLSSSALEFAPTNIGQRSGVQAVTLLNETPLTVTVSGVSVTAGKTSFGASNNCGTPLAPGASCIVNVQMTPVVVGELSGALSIVTSSGSHTVSLHGAGVEPTGGTDETPGDPDEEFIHYVIKFLDTPVSTSSAVRNVTFKNKGDGPLFVSSISLVDGLSEFGMSNNCQAILLPGQSCVISIQFTPAELGARTGGIALLSDGGNFYFDLEGKGTGAAGKWSASTTSDFGNVAVGKSVLRNFWFRNTGSLTLKDLEIGLVGQDVSIEVNGCSRAQTPVLPIGSACSVTVKYAPSKDGELTDAALTAYGSFVDGPVTQPLTGASPAPALGFDSAPSPDFGKVPAGTSVTRYFTVRNTSKLPATLLGAVQLDSSDFTLVSTSCSAGRVLSANEACYVLVKLRAGQLGDTTSTAYSGTLSLQSAEGASAALSLVGASTPSPYTLEFVDATKGEGDFGDIAAPATVSHLIKLTNTARGAQTISQEPTLKSAAPEFSLRRSSTSCIAGAVLSAGSSCYVYVTVTVPAGSTPGTYDLAATLVASTVEGAAVEMALTAQYTQEAYSLEFVDTNVAGGAGAFGNIKAPATVSHLIRLTNSSKSTQTLSAEPQLTEASPEFSLRKSGTPCSTGTVLSAGSSCYVYAVVTLPAGSPPGTYSLLATLAANTEEGGAVKMDLTAQYTQEAYSLELLDTNVAGGKGTFGTIKAPATVSHLVKLTNSSKSTQTLAAEPRLTEGSSEFSLRKSATPCSTGTVLPAGSSCYVYVVVTLPAGASPGTYDLAATLAADTKEGGAVEMALTAQYTQEAYSLEFVDTNVAGGAGAFGNIKAPATVSHLVRLTNSSKSTQTLSAEPQLADASPEFSLRKSATPCSTGTALSAGSSCYVYVVVTLPAGSPPGTYYLAAKLVTDTREGGDATLALTAQYTQEPYSMSLAFTGGTADYGTITSGSSSTKSFLIYNRSKSNQTIASIGLSGEGLSFSSNPCDGKVVAAGSYCTVTVRASAPAGIPVGGGYPITGAFGVTTTEGGAVDTPIYARYGK